MNADLPPGRGGDVGATWAEYKYIVEKVIANAPRTLQTRIGPSELGTDCTRCLAHKLAGAPEARDTAWLPWIGTAVHAQLAAVFEGFNVAVGEQRFLVEHRVSVGEVNGVDITGNVDLYDAATAEVTDWKVVGVTTLGSARASGPSPTYRVQQHLYGLGLTRAGLPVDTVRVAYLPRNAPTLDAAVIWTQPFDPDVAHRALRRADALARAIDVVGLDAVLAPLSPTAGCHSCSRYPLADGTRPPTPGHRPGSDLRGLVQDPAA